ncbi:MAG TPA: hypothetical protein VNB23_05785 [Ramlibacter sp.]|nr:hypothetical protein [Ramlibacter sp.]
MTVLLLAAAVSSVGATHLWRTSPYLAALGAFLFLLGGGFGIRYPRGSLAYSLLFGGTLGLFAGSGVALVLHNQGG